MEKKTFKDILDKVLLGNGFFKKSNRYHFSGSGYDCIVGLQKSNFSNSFYVNIGFFLKNSEPAKENMTEAEGDVRSRFSFLEDNKQTDLFNLDKFPDESTNQLNEIFKENLLELTHFASEDEGLKKLLLKKPILLYQTTLSTKKKLGFS